jgi:DNA-binding winged helix-turn-helix (wHTH) protein
LGYQWIGELGCANSEAGVPVSIINKQQNFQLRELIVLPSRNCLQLGERQLSVQPKVMEVLQYLALIRTGW